MSGIVAIVNARGAPLDTEVLKRMTNALRFRGPAECRTHSNHATGLGHTLLAAQDGRDPGVEQFSIESDLWLTADMRLDDRESLAAALKAAGQKVKPKASDAELLLASYRAWGTGCVERLRGDFAFAIWDKDKRRLFCARDHFGIKPLFYLHRDDELVVCSSLDSMRLHPRFTASLNDRAIADFLTFSFVTDPGISVYSDAYRLSPARALTFENRQLRIERYWHLPVPETLRYRRHTDYLEHFRELLQMSTADRMPSGKAAIYLSGGLDSTSIAESAAAARTRRGGPLEIQAFTYVYDYLIPDDERQYALMATDCLGIPVSFSPTDALEPFSEWGSTPEPIHYPFFFAELDHYQEILAHSHVILSGQGGDESLSSPLVVELLGHMPFFQVVGDACATIFRYRRRPGIGLRSVLKRSRGASSDRLPVPDWIRPEIVAQFELRARSDALRFGFPDTFNPTRRRAYRRLSSPLLPAALELEEPNMTRLPVEYRYPYLDLRLVEFLLAIPPLPWCVDKLLIRQSMRGRLPDVMLDRPKSPLANDPLAAKLRATGHEFVDNLKRLPELERFIDAGRVPDVATVLDSPHKLWESLTPASLALWFQNR